MQNSFLEIKSGKVIDGYVVIRQIGHGATSRVFEVKSKTSKRHYALKLFDSYGGKNVAQKRKLFLFEANRLRNLADQADKDARIPKIHEICTKSRLNYYVMDLVRAVDGNVWSLDDIQFGRCKTDIPYTEETLVGWFLELAKTLIYVHASGILHCDIKPRNILIDRNAHAVLVDYGSSRYFQSRNQFEVNTSLKDFVSGTQEFMPFEALSFINKRINQSSERPISFSTAFDVYSLGATFWQLLFAEPLPLEDDPDELIRDERHKNLIDDKRWVKILPRMLQRRPSARISLIDCVNMLCNGNSHRTDILKTVEECEVKMNRHPTLDDCDKKVYDIAYCELMKQMKKYDMLLQKLRWESGGKVYEKEFVIKAIYDRYRVPELRELRVIYGSADKTQVSKAYERLLAQDSLFMTDFIEAGLQPLADALFFKLNALWSSVVDKDDHSYSEAGKVYIEQRVAEIRCYLPYAAQFVFGKYRHIKWSLDSDYFVDRIPLPKYRGERAADRLFCYERTIAAYIPHKDVAEMQIDFLAKRNKLEGLKPSSILDMRKLWKFD